LTEDKETCLVTESIIFSTTLQFTNTMRDMRTVYIDYTHRLTDVKSWSIEFIF